LIPRIAKRGSPEVLQLLLSFDCWSGTWVHDFTDHGYLGVAITSQHWTVVEFLLKAGAPAGSKALVHAVRSPNPSAAVRLLLQNGVRDEGDAACTAASKLGLQEVVDMLKAGQQ
jgi:hypothetical protein